MNFKRIKTNKISPRNNWMKILKIPLIKMVEILIVILLSKTLRFRNLKLISPKKIRNN